MSRAMDEILKRHETLAQRLLQAGAGRGEIGQAAAERETRRQLQAALSEQAHLPLRRQAQETSANSKGQDGATAAPKYSAEAAQAPMRISFSAENGEAFWTETAVSDASARNGGLTAEALSRLFAREARRYD